METSNTPRLLAVDDDPDSAELVVRVAERCGYEAFATSDSRGVINLAKALQADVLAVDICMPNIDASELFRLMSEARLRAKILIISGQDKAILDATKRKAEGFGLEVPDVLQKPVDFRKLRDMLTKPEVQAVA
jgi:DNA-binding response OmpR family regulator